MKISWWFQTSEHCIRDWTPQEKRTGVLEEARARARAQAEGEETWGERRIMKEMTAGERWRGRGLKGVGEGKRLVWGPLPFNWAERWPTFQPARVNTAASRLGNWEYSSCARVHTHSQKQDYWHLTTHRKYSTWPQEVHGTNTPARTWHLQHSYTTAAQVLQFTSKLHKPQLCFCF